MRFATALRTVFVIAASVALGSGPAGAAPVGITRIVDTDTPVPGGTGAFMGFREQFYLSPPALEGARVAFLGIGADGQSGIYTAFEGSLDVVADTNTPIPAGSGNFDDFGTPSLDGGSVAFLGGGVGVGVGSSRQAGIYTNVGGSLHVVVDRTTPIPGGTSNFSGLSKASL